jgi:purine-binding chemotaxis protein CheW
MTAAARKAFDWRRIHADLDRRLSSFDSRYENDPARVQSLLRERAMRLAKPPATVGALAAQARLLVFRAAGERYGLALDGAHEICRIGHMAALPGCSAAVLGMIGWRGEFAIVFDMSRLLRLAQSESHAPFAIVLRGATEPHLALAATGLDGIVRETAQPFAPARFESARHDLFRGVTRDAVIMLDQARLLDTLKEELRVG